MVASFTDFLDGQIARKYNLITDFGKLMDPLADKIMVLTAMFSMVFGNQYIPGVIPLVPVLILFVKEVYMVQGSYRMLRKGLVVHSQMSGKVAHCAFILGLVLSYFHDAIAALTPNWPMSLDIILIGVAVGIALYAMVFYTRDSIKKVREYEAAQSEQ
jgi:CDP-diacylglycerol--glycerol-3-phosphate 3-phosphatidyltransferase